MDKTNEQFNFVYRYRNFNENAVEAFRNNRLYFSTPSHFNDPFDAVVYIDGKKLCSSIFRDIDEEMETYLNVCLDKPGSLVTSWNKDYFLKFSKNPDIIKMFLKDVIKTVEGIREKILENSKMICFSKQHLSILMWSHYADYHRGFALAYSLDEVQNAKGYDEKDCEIPVNLKLQKISYNAQMKDYGEIFYNFLPNMYRGFPLDLYSRFYTEMVFNKTKEWEYEEEYRLCSIPKNFQEVDPVHYITVQPKILFLGAKMPPKQKWELYNIAKKKDIDVFEVRTNTDCGYFRLNFQRVDSKELRNSARKER